MNNRLFNLPNNILMEIYQYDDTYRDIFKKMIIHEMWVFRSNISVIKFYTKYGIKFVLDTPRNLTLKYTKL